MTNSLSGLEQGQRVKEVWRAKLSKDETWGVLDSVWFRQWCEHSGFDADRNAVEESRAGGPAPGPIDNSRISNSEDPVQLRMGLSEGDDYVLVHDDVLNLLVEWYGGGPIYRRKVVIVGLFRKTKLDMYPLFAHVYTCDGRGVISETSTTITLARNRTLQSLKDELVEDSRFNSVPVAPSKTDKAADKAVDKAEDEEAEEPVGDELTKDKDKDKAEDENENENENDGSAEALQSLDSDDDNETKDEGLQMRFWLSTEDEEVEVSDDDEDDDGDGDDNDKDKSGPELTTVSGADADGEDADAAGETAGETAGEGEGESDTNDATKSEKKKKKKKKTKMQKKWVLVEEDEMELPLENFQLQTSPALLVEVRMANGQWPREQPPEDFRNFKVGQIIDAMDTVKKWYESTVRAVREDEVFIHFNQWPDRWDEWIARDSDRLQPRGTHTSGPRRKRAYRSYMNHQSGEPPVKGAVGLRNLGNTCFMNSTLQCMSHASSLTEFFLDEDYESQINRDNPLGWNGKVAEAYAGLLKELWSGQYTSVVPRNFKTTIGEFQPRFSGYQQQDSSELLSFLLDGLHEDLNLVHKKPATQSVESNGRPDKVVAEEAWQTHLLRNQSIIVDQFQGQLKSRVECPNCTRVSITFDPFMFLSVPMPMVKDRVQKVTFISDDGQGVPVVYGAIVPKLGVVSDLKASVAALAGVASPDHIVLADVFGSRMYRVLSGKSPVAQIRDTDDIFAYELGTIDVSKYAVPNKRKTCQTAEDAVDADADAKMQEHKEREAKQAADAADADDDAEPGVSDGYVKVDVEEGEIVDADDDGDDDDDDEEMAGEGGEAAADSSDDDLDGYGPMALVSTSSAYSRKAYQAPNGAYAVQLVMQSARPNPRHNPHDRYSRAVYVDKIGLPLALVLPPKAIGRHVRELVHEKVKPWLQGELRETLTVEEASSVYDIVVLDMAGRSCDRCPMSQYCDGCVLGEDEDDKVVFRAKKPCAFGVRFHDPEQEYDHERAKEAEEHESVAENERVLKSQVKSEIDVQDCIRAFTQEEKLSEEDAWYCRQCKDHVQATKKFDLYKLPDVFICHLKRFAYTKVSREKIGTYVEFPLEGLDLAPFCVNADETGDAVYDCFAISNHFGGLGGGHYTAYAKNFLNNKWYNLDDSHVSEVDESRVKTSAAYVLFYVRRNRRNRKYRISPEEAAKILEQRRQAEQAAAAKKE